MIDERAAQAFASLVASFSTRWLPLAEQIQKASPGLTRGLWHDLIQLGELPEDLSLRCDCGEKLRWSGGETLGPRTFLTFYRCPGCTNQTTITRQSGIPKGERPWRQ